MISIISPVYNVAAYLDKCIESVLNQTYNDWELILIDDNSTDGSLEIANAYAKKDSRIKILHLTKNSGPAHARNIGIDAAKGDYLSFIDSDDTIGNRFLSSLASTALQYGPDIVWCQYNQVQYDNQNKSHHTIIENHLPKLTPISRNEALMLFFKQVPGIGSMCNKLYKRELIQLYDIHLNESRHRAEDWEFNIKYFRHINFIIAIEDAHYNYIRRKSSVMDTFRDKDLHLMYQSVRLLRSIKAECSLSVSRGSFALEFLPSIMEYVIKSFRYAKSPYIILKEITSNPEFRFLCEDEADLRLPKTFSLIYTCLKHNLILPAWCIGKLLSIR